MRCSSCEPHLEAYREGSLSPRRALDVGTHMRACAGCRALLDEIKAVDGLLVTAHTVELPANFTFAVMAEAASLPAPRPRRASAGMLLALYLTAAWVAVAIASMLTGFSPVASAGSVWSGFAPLATLSPTAPALAVLGISILVIDVTVGVLIGVFHFRVRPRLAARRAVVSEA